MSYKHLVARWCALCVSLSSVLGAHAQTYPSKPIRIVTSAAGGNNDLIARIIAPGLSAALAQPIVIDNRNAVAGGEMVAKGPPDGHTLLLFGSTLWIGPLLQPSPFDPLTDFAPITQASTAPLMLVVHPSLPERSVRELISLAKSKPRALNYGSGAAGAITQLAAELFKSMAGVDIVRVPYKGDGPAVTDLIGGQIQLIFATTGSVVAHVKSGRLRGLAVTGAQRSALAPDLPTVAATLPGFEASSVVGIFAPPKTPALIISRLNTEISRYISLPDTKEKLLVAAASEVVASSPEQLTAAMKADIARMGKVIREAGIRAE
jgi:tripartite-type tricarboxylate transporter receptor subunit TctC